MSPHSRRRALRGGLVTATTCLTGCLFTSEREENNTGRTRYESDVSLDSVASWPSYRRDAQNTGYSSEVSGPTNDATVAWRYSAHTEANSGVVVDDGRVYAGGLVLDGEHGQRIGGEWRGHAKTPTVADGMVFVPAHDLEARNSATGEIEWTFEPDGKTGALQGVTVMNGIVFVVGNVWQPLVYAVDIKTGKETWRWDPDQDVVGAIRSAPAVDEDTVYLVDEDGGVYAISSETGDKQWRQLTGITASGSPVVVDGTVYLGSENNEVIALRADDGEPRWHRKLSHEVIDTTAATPDEIFASGADGSVTRLTTADGTIEWEQQFDDAGRLGSPTVTDDTIYIGSENDGTVLALAAADGTEQWRVETRRVDFGDYSRAGVVNGPAVVDGVVYVGTAPGDVYAIAAA